MLKIFTKYQIFAMLVFLNMQVFAQQSGDYKSKATGNWGDFNTWQIFDGTTWQNATAGQIPGGTSETTANNVFLEAGFTVTLEADHSCKNINLNTTADVIRINTQNNTLNVWGKMRFYEGTAPGAATPNPVISSGILGWITTGATGFIRFKGTTDRIIMVQGEINANNTNSGWNLDFAFDNGFVGELNDRFRAGNMTISSGTLFVNNPLGELRVGTNNGAGDVTPNGVFLIKSGAMVKGGSGIFKKSTTAAQSITVENGATLEINKTGYVLAATVLNLSGTIVLQNAINFPTEGGRTNAVLVNTFNNLDLEGAGAKTLQNNVTVNGKLTLGGTSSLALGTFILSYGPNGQLEYNGTTQQTTTNSEFPNTNGPLDLIINNDNDVVLNAEKTIQGQLTLTSGLFKLGNNNFFLGANSPAVAGNPSNTNMVVADGIGILFKVFAAPGTFLYPVGNNTAINEYSYAQITINSASALDATTYFGIRVKKVEHPAVSGIASADIARYWGVATNMTGFSYNGVFQYLPTDVNGNENDLNAYIFSNETAGATGIAINKVDPILHRIVIKNINQVGFVTAANLCAISNNTISTTSSTEFCGNATGIQFDGTAATVTSGNPVYHWQKSVNEGAFADIATNAQSEDFTETATLTSGTYSYRRVVSDPATCNVTDVNISNEITITVIDQITGNTVGNDQTITSGGDPAAFVETGTLAGGSGTFTYQWQSSTTQGGPYSNIATANGATYDVPSGLTITTYYVRVVNSGACTSTSNEIKITVTPLSISKNTLLTTSIYPNPISSDKDLIIDLGNNQFKKIEIKLFNSTGIIISSEIINSPGNNVSINMNDLQKGIYFIQIVADDNKMALEKVVKE